MTHTPHTPGPWTDSPKASDAVISQSPDGLPAVSLDGHLEWYGGFVIAESIAPCNKPIIRAAPKMKHALIAWQTLAEESLAFRLALTALDHNIGVNLLTLTQEAIAEAETGQ